jgi:hypothetical protein
MKSNKGEVKQTRKKRRVPGSATPPRVSFLLRMEQAKYLALMELLKGFDGSRNDYICSLLDIELKHAERFKALNTHIPDQSD